MKKLMFLMLFLLVFAGVVVAQPDPDAIPAYLLINVDGFDPSDPLSEDVGYPLQAFDYWQLMGKQVPPDWIQLTLLDTTVGEAQAYCAIWWRKVDYEFVAHNYAVDGHRLRVFVKPEWVSASGINGLTRERVENYLDEWGATVFSIAQNEVVFDAGVFNAIASDGFWGMDVSAVDFTEKSYDQDTGVHKIEANYSAVNIDSAFVNWLIGDRGCTVVKDIPNKVTFTCGRDIVFDDFKLDVKSHVDGIFSDRKWYLTTDFIEAAYANGGNLDMNRQDALPYFHNRLDD